MTFKQLSRGQDVDPRIRGKVVEIDKAGPKASYVLVLPKRDRWLVCNSILGELDDAGRKLVASLSQGVTAGTEATG